jgi:hypothetical protein
MSEQAVSGLEKIAEGAQQITAILGQATPIAAGVAAIIGLIIDEFKKRGIDTGPFEDRIAHAKQTANEILDADAAYRLRHPPTQGA